MTPASFTEEEVERLRIRVPPGFDADGLSIFDAGDEHDDRYLVVDEHHISDADRVFVVFADGNDRLRRVPEDRALLSTADRWTRARLALYLADLWYPAGRPHMSAAVIPGRTWSASEPALLVGIERTTIQEGSLWSMLRTESGDPMTPPGVDLLDARLLPDGSRYVDALVTAYLAVELPRRWAVMLRENR